MGKVKDAVIKYYGDPKLKEAYKERPDESFKDTIMALKDWADGLDLNDGDGRYHYDRVQELLRDCGVDFEELEDG